MDLLGSLGARYCARQNAHAYFLFWGLFLTLAGTTVALYRRRLPGFAPAAPAFFACCTAALGATVFYGCYRWVPYSMGLDTPEISSARLNAFMCLNQDAFSTALVWTFIVVACGAALGIVAWARTRTANVGLRLLAYAVALVCVFLAGAAAVFRFFGFAYCLSNRLF